MASNKTTSLMNLITREAQKVAGIRRLLGAREMSYAAAAEVDEGLSERSNDVVEYDVIEQGAKRGGKFKENHEMRNTTGDCEWVPHPRSGIYFPKGHDWVLDDVAHSPASSRGPTFWLRSIDGVDGPHIDNF